MIFIVRITLVFLLGGMLAALLRHRSAAARHFVWTLTLGGALALALLVPIAPRLELPVTTVGTATPAPEASAPQREVPITAASAVKETLAAVTAQDAAAPRAAWAPSPLLLLWLSGFGAVILWCAMGHWGLVRLARRAAVVEDADWLALLAEAAALAGVTRPVRLLRSAAVGTPMTWGFLRPVVMLPADAGEWSAERRRVVLLHELAHVARLEQKRALDTAAPVHAGGAQDVAGDRPLELATQVVAT